MQVKFEYQNVRIYSVSFPELEVNYNDGAFNGFVDSEYADLEEVAREGFESVAHALDELDKERMARLEDNDTSGWTASGQRKHVWAGSDVRDPPFSLFPFQWS